MLKIFDEQLLVIKNRAVTTGIQKLSSKTYRFTIRKGSGDHLKQRTQRIKAASDSEAQTIYRTWYSQKLSEISESIETEKDLGPKLSWFIRKGGQFDKLGQEEVKRYANTNNSARVKSQASWQRVMSSLRWIRKDGILGDTLGKKPLGAIKREDVEMAFAELRPKYKYNSLHNFKGNLTKVFKLAIEAKILPEDFDIPSSKVDIGPVATRPDQKTSFEVEDYMHAADLIKTLALHYRLFYTLALGAGMRRGEIMALQLSDFDFEHGLIHIDRSMTERSINPGVKPGLQTEIKPGTKNGKTRVTKLTGLVKEALEEYLKVFKPIDWIDPSTGKTWQLLFTNPKTGKPYTLSTMSCEWRRVRDKWFAQGEIKEKTTLHNLRGSFITYMLIHEHVDRLLVARMVGHENPELTYAVYANPTARDIENLRLDI